MVSIRTVSRRSRSTGTSRRNRIRSYSGGSLSSSLFTVVDQVARRAASAATRSAVSSMSSQIMGAGSKAGSYVKDWFATSRPAKLAVPLRVGGRTGSFPIPRGRRIYSRKVRKFKKKRSLNQHTFQFSMERGSSISPTVSGILGHITCPRKQILRAMFGAILRKLFVRVGLKCVVPSRPMDGISLAGVDTVTFFFEYGSASLDAYSFTLSAGATFTQALDSAVGDWVAKFNALSGGLSNSNVRFTKVQYSRPGTAQIVTNDLLESKIQLYSTSMLKIQNRSVGEVGDENADDVDNVPVQGKVYSGWGTGPDSRYQTDNLTLVELHGDVENGVIAVSNPENMSDAPLVTQFNGVKRSGFVKIMPGQINRHYLKYNTTMYLNNFLRLIMYGLGDNNLAMKIGKFGFIVVEKTLESNNTTPLAMNLVYEHQLNLTTKLINANADAPVPEFKRL